MPFGGGNSGRGSAPRKLANAGAGRIFKPQQPIFPRFLSEEATALVLRDPAQSCSVGSRHVGLLRVQQAFPDAAWVTSSSTGVDIFVESRKERNRTVDGDEVVVEVIPPPATSSSAATGRVFGRVVGVVKNNHAELSFCAVLDEGGSSRDFYKLVPTNEKLPWVLVPKAGAGAAPPQRARGYLVTITDWFDNSMLPRGRLQGEIGALGVGVFDTEECMSLLDHDLRRHLCPFSADVEAEAADIVREALVNFDAELAYRRDFRAKRVLTIDPRTARDLDDAVHIEFLTSPALQRTIVEVGVHIADVSHFVRPRGAVDAEARRRSTTVYLQQHSFPMLPRALSDEICSLHPGTPKLTFSALLFFELDGSPCADRPPEFCKSVVETCARFSYEDVQLVLDAAAAAGAAGDSLEERVERVAHPPLRADVSWTLVWQDLLLLEQLTRKMRAKRFRAGSVRMSCHYANCHLGTLFRPAAQPEDARWVRPDKRTPLQQDFAARLKQVQSAAWGRPTTALLGLAPAAAANLPGTAADQVLEAVLRGEVPDAETFVVPTWPSDGPPKKTAAAAPADEALELLLDCPANDDDDAHAAHWLIEELMLAANVAVAQRLVAVPDTQRLALLRRHAPPDADKLGELQAMLASLGVTLAAGDSLELSQSLERLRQSLEPLSWQLISYVLVRVFMRAEYAVLGAAAPAAESRDPLAATLAAMHHYALNFPLYTHFTSPIRRYPDLLVHRLLAAAELSALTSQFQQQDQQPADLRRLLSEEELTVPALASACAVANKTRIDALHAHRSCASRFLATWLLVRANVYPTLACVMRAVEDGVVLYLPKFETEVKLCAYAAGKLPKVFDSVGSALRRALRLPVAIARPARVAGAGKIVWECDSDGKPLEIVQSFRVLRPLPVYLVPFERFGCASCTVAPIPPWEADYADVVATASTLRRQTREHALAAARSCRLRGVLDDIF